MTAKSLLLEEFSASFDEENWFIPLTKAIAGLTAEEAAWKDGSANHSVWQIVNHLLFWNERYFNRFKGTPLPPIEIDNAATFNGTDADWQATVDRVTTLMNDWRKIIAESEESKFDEASAKDNNNSWGSVLGHINLHTAYHTGQILYVRKQQGKWN